ncbi:MAG: ABC transporter permease [Alphaproteobacteria bacterium]|nr:ABC transporter permease [Alphaproteobacteria bacterium]
MTRLPAALASLRQRLRTAPAPIVPRGGEIRFLLIVIAAICALGTLALVAGLALSGAADRWSAGLEGSATVELLPVEGLAPGEQRSRAISALAAAPGVIWAEEVPKADAEALLAPWLGEGVDLGSLPMPQLIAVRLEPGAGDAQQVLASALAEVPGARADTHAGARASLATLARTARTVALAITLLIAVAGTAIVVFATRATLAAHRDIVDVLHLMGAHDGFIASAFERRFLELGLMGGAAGAALALLLIVAVMLAVPEAAMAGFLPEMEIGWAEALAILATPLFAALVAWGTARLTVLARLRRAL